MEDQLRSFGQSAKFNTRQSFIMNRKKSILDCERIPEISLKRGTNEHLLRTGEAGSAAGTVDGASGRADVPRPRALRPQ